MTIRREYPPCHHGAIRKPAVKISIYFIDRPFPSSISYFHLISICILHSSQVLVFGHYQKGETQPPPKRLEASSFNIHPMDPWNTSSAAEAQPSLTAPYSYLATSNGQYQPQVPAPNYTQPNGSNMNIQYSTQRQNIQQPQAQYSNSGAGEPATGQQCFQQPPPGSLAALELQLHSQQQSTMSAMQNVPTLNAVPSQTYMGNSMSGQFGNVAGSSSFPAAPNNASFMPNYPLVDQNMLAGPASGYSTSPNFYDSEGAWSFNSSGQEVRLLENSAFPLQPQSNRSSSRERTQGSAQTNPEATYDCPVDGCNKIFNRSYNYRAHMETHSANRVYPFDCPVENCDKRFRRKTDLQRHHVSVHEKQRDHQCGFCGRFFSRKDTLRRHKDDGCSRRFETSFDLPAQGDGSGMQ